MLTGPAGSHFCSFPLLRSPDASVLVNMTYAECEGVIFLFLKFYLIFYNRIILCFVLFFSIGKKLVVRSVGFPRSELVLRVIPNGGFLLVLEVVVRSRELPHIIRR